MKNQPISWPNPGLRIPQADVVPSQTLHVPKQPITTRDWRCGTAEWLKTEGGIFGPPAVSGHKNTHLGTYYGTYTRQLWRRLGGSWPCLSSWEVAGRIYRPMALF